MLSKSIAQRFGGDNSELAHNLSLLNRYVLEACRTFEQLELHSSAMYANLTWRERYAYISKLNNSIPQSTKDDLRSSPLEGQQIFHSDRVSTALNSLRQDVTLQATNRILQASANHSRGRGKGVRRQAPAKTVTPLTVGPPAKQTRVTFQNDAPRGRGQKPTKPFYKGKDRSGRGRGSGG